MQFSARRGRHLHGLRGGAHLEDRIHSERLAHNQRLSNESRLLESFLAYRDVVSARRHVGEEVEPAFITFRGRRGLRGGLGDGHYCLRDHGAAGIRNVSCDGSGRGTALAKKRSARERSTQQRQ